MPRRRDAHERTHARAGNSEKARFQIKNAHMVQKGTVAEEDECWRKGWGRWNRIEAALDLYGYCTIANREQTLEELDAQLNKYQCELERIDGGS